MTKTDFDNSVSSLDSKFAANKTKISSSEDRLFYGESHFKEDGMQNYLALQPINKYFKVIASTDYVSSWKSKGLSAETIKPPATSDNSLVFMV